MLFSDPVFFVFFIPYFILHFLIPARHRIWLVIIGSTIFYAWWRPIYVFLPYILTGIAWAAARWLDDAADDRVRRFRLIVALVLMFLPLAVVKYTYFIANDVLLLRGAVDTDQLRWPLPLGISFITFTLSAYMIDVYRRRYEVERSLSILLAYVLFFPHLIAGPILRPYELMPQFKQLRAALGARFMTGIAIFTLGLIKKLVFADSIAEVVDRVYASGGTGHALESLIAIYGFSVQIYCDFSGYTDMAIGIAYLLRIRLPTNFLRPYKSRSIIEFWRRWHITLSHWLRDYLYIALGGNRGGKVGQFRNIMITMVLGGLWHGANWTFLIWGFLHGLALGVTHLVRRSMQALGIAVPAWASLLLTFHFVTFAWIYFRAPDVASAHRVIEGTFVGSWSNPLETVQRNAFVILLMILFAVSHRYDRHALIRLLTARVTPVILWPCIGLCWILAIAISQGSSAKFIYFDF